MRKINYNFGIFIIFAPIFYRLFYIFMFFIISHSHIRFLRASIALLIILSGLLFSQCRNSASSFHSCQGMVWGTVYHITFRGEESLADSIQNIFNKVGKSLSIFDKASIVAEVNANDSVAVDSMFMEVYNESLRVNGASRGMFDPTVSPLITAWGFGPGHTLSADTMAVDSIMDFIGIRKTRLVGDRLVKDDIRTQFNFSALAKGYGCDMIGRFLLEKGVTDFIVEVGGEIVAHGKNPDGMSWRVSIDRPLDGDGKVVHSSQCIIEMKNAAVATSGNYRNFHEIDKRKVGHTISPVTGHPVQTDILSATVVARTCMTADALATACMALGSTEARDLCASENAPVMIVLADSSVWMSESFRALLYE